MKWYNYLACYFAGVFLIHIIPHLLHGFTLTNILGAIVSLVGGSLLLWAGKFSFKNPLAIILLIAGIASVLIFEALRLHHPSATESSVRRTTGTISIELLAARNGRQVQGQLLQASVGESEPKPKPVVLTHGREKFRLL